MTTQSDLIDRLVTLSRRTHAGDAQQYAFDQVVDELRRVLDERPLLTREDVGTKLQLSVGAVRRLERSGKLPPVWLSRQSVRYHPADLDRLMQGDPEYDEELEGESCLTDSERNPGINLT